MVRITTREPLGHGSRRGRDAVRGRSGGRRARCAADRSADHHVHRIAGSAVDAAQHVQDRGGTHRVLHARGGAQCRHARAFDLRGPFRCDGGPPERFRDARLRFPTGSSGPRRHRARRDCGVEGAVPALLRRVPHLTRDPEDRSDRQRHPAGPARPGRCGGTPRPGAVPRAPGGQGHLTEPRRVLPGSRGRERVPRRLPRGRRGDDATLR